MCLDFQATIEACSLRYIINEIKEVYLQNSNVEWQFNCITMENGDNKHFLNIQLVVILSVHQGGLSAYDYLLCVLLLRFITAPTNLDGSFPTSQCKGI